MSEALTVLIVDDDGSMRSLLGRVLTSAGMLVTCFASAADLLGAGDLATADVLLLDLSMPEMSGMDLHSLLRLRGFDLPVLFVSGTADLGTAVEAMRNGAVDFIEKPFDIAAVAERVRRAVRLHGGRLPRLAQGAEPLVAARFALLTPREREVFKLLITGMSSKLIARELGGSFRTIEIHRAQVMRKMEAANLSELVRLSVESPGLDSREP